MSESYTAVGMVEFNSIAAGIDAADQMVKTAQVDPLFFKTICPGKFVAAVTGDVAAVSASVNAGRETHADALVDWFIIPNIHRDVIGALAGATGITERRRARHHRNLLRRLHRGGVRCRRQGCRRAAP